MAERPDWYRPAKPYEPGNQEGRKFEPANTLSRRHGSWSPRLVDPLALEIAGEYRQMAEAEGSSCSWLIEPSYRGAVLQLARTEARVHLVSTWLTQQGGDLDDKGDVRSAARHLLGLEASAGKQRSELGLTPLSRARLGRDVASGKTSATLTAVIEQRLADRATGDHPSEPIEGSETAT